MATGAHTKSGLLELKKYANRRYYDAANSRHLTLQNIRSLVQQGQDLRVIDATSSADITSQVLAQVILEFEPEKLDVLPEGFLASVLRGQNPFAGEVLRSVAPGKEGSDEAGRIPPPAMQSAHSSSVKSSSALPQPTKGEAHDLLQALAVARERIKPPG